MEPRRAFIIDASIGGLAFWLPIVTADFLAAPDYPNLYLVSITPLISLLIAYGVRVVNARSKVRLALSMMAGLWLFGPLMIATGGSQHGLRFHEHPWFVLLSMVIPFLTWVLSGYHGSWFALNLGTLILIGMVVWHSARARA